MKRVAVFAYGVVSYLTFFGTFLYAMAFVGNLGVPKAIDGPLEGSFAQALLINLILLSIFAVQHSVMARPAFKRWWTTIIPDAAERSTYTLFSSLALILLFWLWRPMGGEVWNVTHPMGHAILLGLFFFGWGLVLVSTLLINHFDLFGLRQVWLYLQGREYTPLPFGTPMLYKYVRHPLYVGWFFAFWATPTMTVTHLTFALVTTAYILVAVRIEERDLAEALPEYAAYSARVPRFIPGAGHNPPE